MEIAELADFIEWCKENKETRTWLIDGALGKGKTQTVFGLIDLLRDFNLKTCFARNGSEVRNADVLALDDFGIRMYKRDFAKRESKDAMKAFQRIRDVIPLLIVTVPDIALLDKDIRETFGVRGHVLKHGWMWVDGVLLGPIRPKQLPPSDTEEREKEVMNALRSL